MFKIPLRRPLCGRKSVAFTATRAAVARSFSYDAASNIRFWDKAADGITWFKKYDKVLDESKSPFNKWFVGGEMNMCYNCLDRHVIAGRGDRTAMIFDSPVTDTIKHITYQDILGDVQQFAGVLVDQGVTAGDRVIIYMPNIPEAFVAMLACARIGAVHCVVFGGFAANELASRITDSKAKMIITASCGIDGAKVIDYKVLVDEAMSLATTAVNPHTVNSCVVYQRSEHKTTLQSTDLDWHTCMQRSQPVMACTPLPSDHPLYLLYTSGTTGQPKGILRDTGGYAVALKWSVYNIYKVPEDGVFWAASDVGWVVGHSYMNYGPLLHGCTSIVYEGKPIGTPDAAAFWRVVEQHGVQTLMTAPTAFRAIRKLDAEGDLPTKHNLSSLQAVFLVGERADPSTIKWAEKSLSTKATDTTHEHRVLVRDQWWQTETGWPVCSNMLGSEGELPIKYGSVYRACPGYNIQILSDNHDEHNEENNNEGPLLAPVGELGKIIIKLPLPPGFMMTLYNNPDRFMSSYFNTIPGYYDTGDAGTIDSDEYVSVMTRTDDVINVAGHRLSTGSMEEVIGDHPLVAEAAVVGIKDALKGQLPIGLVVLHDHCTMKEEDVTVQLVEMVRHRIGAVTCFKEVKYVKRLPKTRSGKVLRGTIRSIANKDTYKFPATIENSDVLIEMEDIFKDY